MHVFLFNQTINIHEINPLWIAGALSAINFVGLYIISQDFLMASRIALK